MTDHVASLNVVSDLADVMEAEGETERTQGPEDPWMLVRLHTVTCMLFTVDRLQALSG